MALDRKANRSWMKRFDHLLFSSLGFGLSHFAPPRRLRALEEGERRYFTAVQRPEDGTVVQRSCLVTLAGTRSYELPRVAANGSAKWPSLHVSCDEGSTGLSALMFCIHSEGLRLTCVPDFCHRLHNDVINATSGAGLTLIRLQFLVVTKLRRGPFAGQANTSILREAAGEMKRTLTAQHALFEMLYDDILSGQPTLTAQPRVGTAKHMEEVWAWATDTLVGVGCGAEAKSGRWFSFERLGRVASERRFLDLFVLLFIGSQRGWWNGFHDTPLNGVGERIRDAGGDMMVGGAEDSVAPGPAAVSQHTGHQAGVGQQEQQEQVEDASITDTPLSIDAGRREVQRRRQQCVNTLHFVSKLLTDDLACRLWAGICRLPLPLEEWFGAMQREIKAPLGVDVVMVQLSAGCLGGVALRLLQHVTWQGFAFAIGLGRPPSSSADFWRKQDKTVMERLWKMCVLLRGEVALTSFFYRLPPQCFAGLRSDDTEQQKECLASLRRPLGFFRPSMKLLSHSGRALSAKHSMGQLRRCFFVEALLSQVALLGQHVFEDPPPSLISEC